MVIKTEIKQEIEMNKFVQEYYLTKKKNPRKVITHGMNRQQVTVINQS